MHIMKGRRLNLRFEHDDENLAKVWDGGPVQKLRRRETQEEENKEEEED